MKTQNLLHKITNYLKPTESEKRKPKTKPKAKTKPKRPPVDWESLPPEARQRADRLREWRRQAAVTRSVPSYVILHNSTVARLALQAPRTLDELQRIPGIGARKRDELGLQILAALT